MVVAILAAILDFSVSSIFFASYPPDFHHRGDNDAKSTVNFFYHSKQVIPGWHPDYPGRCRIEVPGRSLLLGLSLRGSDEIFK